MYAMTASFLPLFLGELKSDDKDLGKQRAFAQRTL
jgi:hypothetical protein